MNWQWVKDNKWKMLSLALIGLFMLTIITGYITGYAQHRGRRVPLREVPLSDDEAQLAIRVATETLADRITDDYIPDVRDFGVTIKQESGVDAKLAFVSFSSPTGDRTYRVGVDLNKGEAVLIIEARDWMVRDGRLGHGPGIEPGPGTWRW